MTQPLTEGQEVKEEFDDSLNHFFCTSSPWDTFCGLKIDPGPSEEWESVKGIEPEPDDCVVCVELDKSHKCNDSECSS